MSESSNPAEDVYAEFLSRRLEGEAVDFEELCRQHPALADELREVHEQSQKVLSALEGLGPPSDDSLADDTAGGLQDTLRHPPELDPGALTPLLERLAGDTREATRYEQRSEIARGGMGSVLLVWDQNLRRNVAMKVALDDRSNVRLDPTAVDDRKLGRFLDEAQITGQLDHPGIVPVYELGVDAAGKVYFTMRLVRGRTLREVLALARSEEDGWTRPRVLGVLLKVCEAVAYAHSKGVIHRDLKPANIMVGRFGEVYVMDWGLAKVVGRRRWQDVTSSRGTVTVQTDRKDFQDQSPASALDTAEGTVVGTPVYMSPEQAGKDPDEVGPQTDVYSVGAILYEAVTGRMPYMPDGKVLAPKHVLTALVSGPPVPVGELAPQTPEPLISICARAMAREPSERYPNMAGLAVDLRAFLEGGVITAYRPGATDDLREWTSRHRRVAAVAGLLILGVVAVLTVVGLDLRSRHQETAAALAEVERFSDLATIEELTRRADTLWPCREAQVPELERWLAEARVVLDRAQSTPVESPDGMDDPAAGQDTAELGRRWRGAMTVELKRRRTDLEALVPAIEGRLETARNLDRITLEDHDDEWSDVRMSIADNSTYVFFQLRPQLGLVPLGADPASGLHEFWHLESGARPERDPATGRWILTGETGLVLVLIPGDGAPFFLSKYELTRGQWARMTGEDPSRAAPGGTAAADVAILPVDSVGGERAREVLARYELTLPTDEQWQLATTTEAVGPPLGPSGVTLVGSSPASRLGLHELSGNLQEWCLTGARDASCAAKGGSYLGSLSGASLDRVVESEGTRGWSFVGVRPARAVR